MTAKRKKTMYIILAVIAVLAVIAYMKKDYLMDMWGMGEDEKPDMLGSGTMQTKPLVTSVQVGSAAQNYKEEAIAGTSGL